MEQKTNKRVMNLIIVDESGSMSIIHDQALSGLNETILTCQNIQKTYPDLEQRVVLLTFTTGRTRILFDNVNVEETRTLTKRDYCPSGGTPLYDAIGAGVAKVNALTEEGDKVLVTIITDGEENSSKEYTLKMVKTLIEKLEKQGWTFTLIGTDNLDVESMADSMSIRHSMSFCQDVEGTERMFAQERSSRIRYSCFMANDMECGDYFVSPDDPVDPDSTIGTQSPSATGTSGTEDTTAEEAPATETKEEKKKGLFDSLRKK